MTPPPPAPASGYRWPIRLGLVLVGFVALLRVFHVPHAYNSGAATNELKAIRSVPPFALTERSGKTITNDDLSGKIWVADFVYTTCPGPCPAITASMARLQGDVLPDPQVQLVTFTVDPQNDTPPVLAKYADSYGADPNRWWFLTGPEKPLYELIQTGFLQAVQDNRGAQPQPGQYTVTHSTYFALVDGDGNVRGFYDGTGTDSRASILRDIKILENEGSR